MGLLFLLLFGSSAFGAVPAYKDACNFGAVPVSARVAAANPVAERVRSIFSANCNSCHGKGASGGAGVMADILDRDGLVRDGFVDLKTPPSSRIFLAISRSSRQMPLGKPPLSLSDKSTILDWIKAGAPAWTDPLPILNPGQIAYEQIVACIDQDVKALDYKKRGDARNYRYFQLDNVYNTGVRASFITLGWALDKALNQLAFGPTKITNATKVDSFGVIRRIDLRDFNRNEDEFDVVLLGKYLYAIDYSKGNYYTRQQRDDIAFYEAEIAKLTRSPRAFIRADFFVDQGLGDLYYQFLFPKRGQADNLQQLERTLDVNANQAIADFEVSSSAIRRSGVSVFNRIIHRYDSTYDLMGVKTTTSYWKTFDVINEIAQRNFFAFPLGPEGVKFDFFTAKVFKFDAGEEIFGLPNGLQGYFIADAKGNRLQEAAINVAVDRDNVSPFLGSAPGVVKAGISCNHCHSGGVNAYTDQLLYHSARTSGLTASEINAINQLYPVQSVLNTSFNTYNTTFLTSHRVIAADPITTVSSSEPTWLADRTYQDYQSVDQVAAEVGLTTDEFNTCLFHSPDLAQAIGLADPTLGRVTRANLDKEFGRIALDCGLGNQVLFKKRGVVRPPVRPIADPKPKPWCELILKNNSGLTVEFTLTYDDTGTKKYIMRDGRFGRAIQRGNPKIEVSAGGAVFKFRLFDCETYTFVTRNGIVTMVKTTPRL